MKEEVENWWKKAEDDLETAEYNLKGRRVDAAAFYCQQSVEKALKTLYIKKFKELIRTHDLLFLGKKLELPEELLSICDKINPFYVGTRYPDFHEEYPIGEISKAIDNAKKVLKWVREKI